jgi:alpha-2-macroglobulin
MHKEFLKNKLTVFIEQMNKGAYEFEIELEPRYSGTYTMNPVKAELMYFPVFYGRNETKQIKIVQ